MGSSASSASSRRSQQSAAAAASESVAAAANLVRARSREWPNRVLFLGTASGGKTTLMKQVFRAHGGEITLAERTESVLRIRDALRREAYTLFTHCSTYSPLPDALLEHLAMVVLAAGEGRVYSPEVGHAVAQLWASPQARETFKSRSQFHLSDGAAFWLDRAREVAGENFVPSEEDYARHSLPSGGVHVRGWHAPVELWDLGGRRSCRKAWVHFAFERVHTIVYVVALSEYDQPLYEDESVNRLRESLRVFGELCHYPRAHPPREPRWSEQQMNKCDVFAEKLATTPLSLYFPEFTGGSDLHSARLFIRDLFLSHPECTQPHLLRTHFCSAIDASTIPNLLNGGWELKGTSWDDASAGNADSTNIFAVS